MRYSHEHKFVLVSNWKCGCSTLAWLFDPVSEFNGLELDQCEATFGKNYDTMCHYPAFLLREEFARKGWDFDSYTSISSVRNPWSRAVSLYGNVRDVGYEGSFDEFVHHELPTWQGGQRRRWNSYEMFHHEGERIVDHIIRIEHLEDDLRPVVQQHWPNLELDYASRRNRGKHEPFREYYSDKSIEAVGDFFAWDVEEFGYGFEDNSAS